MAPAARLPFQNLTPDRILAAVEGAGWRCDGRLLALNSFENRVYQLGIDDGPPIVVKFYRPRRWSDAAIGEEHGFCAELAAAEIPVVAPCATAQGATLIHAGEYRLAVYPKRPGRAPELDDESTLEWLGRFIARIHAVGERRAFVFRPSVDIAAYGERPLAALLRAQWIPRDLHPAFAAGARHALDRARRRFADAGAVRSLRLHADCHAGNVLWTDEGPHFVDFDDCRTGPAIQDLWMLLSGDRAAMTRQLGAVLAGYEVFRQLDRAELALIEPLRTLRMLHYAAWLGERWHDPAFPAAFPWFGTERYWQDQILALQEQIAAMDEPPLDPG
ncbi:MAG: serine/threonine protein kinase [Burkholderiales bacterium]|nr:serine/threonine protein kinase [Burkholderiales bacterium]